MIYTYTVTYTDGRTGSTADKTQEIQAPNLSTAIAKGAAMAERDRAVETYMLLYVRNTNNSDLLFDQSNEFATISLDDLA